MLLRGHELGRRLGELGLEPVGGVGLAAQPSAPGRAHAEREVDTRIRELGQDRLFDLVQRDAPACGPELPLVERALDLADAVGRVVLRAAANWIAVDDGLQHERVVRVQPEREALVARPAVEGGLRHVQRRDIPIERGARLLQGVVVDEPVANVQLEDLIERAVQRAGGRLTGRDARNDDERGHARERGARTDPTHGRDSSRSGLGARDSGLGARTAAATQRSNAPTQDQATKTRRVASLGLAACFVPSCLRGSGPWAIRNCW